MPRGPYGGPRVLGGGAVSYGRGAPVPTQKVTRNQATRISGGVEPVQGYLAHKKPPLPLGPPSHPRYSPIEDLGGGCFL